MLGGADGRGGADEEEEWEGYEEALHDEAETIRPRLVFQQRGFQQPARSTSRCSAATEKRALR